jgi:L,D-peptidoglycan transpeptidase YkuD (ErfK/YbiS/YcfS/YnhG family)
MMVVLVVMNMIAMFVIVLLVMAIGAVDVGRPRARSFPAEDLRIELAMFRDDDLRRRIDLPQGNFHSLASIVINPVCFIEQDEIGIADLFLLRGATPPGAGEIRPIDDEDHPANHRALLQLRHAEVIEHFLGIGQAGGFDPDEVQIGIFGKCQHLLDQILKALAANATAGDASQFELAPRQQRGIDVYGAKIVDDYRGAFERNVGVGEPVTERGGFAAAQKAGQHQKREGVGARHAVQLPFAGNHLTVAQMYRLMAVFFVTLGLGCLDVTDSWAAADLSRLGLDAKQMVVCIAPDSKSSEGSLQLFQRDAVGQWQPDGKPWPVLFGSGGLAWGRGLNPPQPGPQKVGGDHRNPAGLFKIGTVLGYAESLPDGAQGWPYHQVTDRDAWIDDPSLAGLGYNHLYTLPPGAPFPAWWDKEHMHLGDFAYAWLVLIEHNYADPDTKAGNEIFFHIRRGEHYRTAGCTTMERDHLEQLIKWLKPGSNAMLAEMTRADYLRLWKDWNLPPPDKTLAVTQ